MSGRLIRMAKTCLQVEELLPAYDDGELAEDEVRRLERHLAGCGSCRALREGLRSSWERLGLWEDLEPAPGWRQDFWRSLGREDERRRWGPLRFLRDRRWAGLATAAVLALGFVGGTLWPQEPVRPTGVTASLQISRSVAELAMAPSTRPTSDLPGFAEVEGPFSTEILEEALSSAGSSTSGDSR